ncbi:hypothetical protein ACFQ0M_37765 [Kitasatospora aburaviensis]
MTVLNALLCLQFAVLEVGVPLWVVQQTDAPGSRWPAPWSSTPCW